MHPSSIEQISHQLLAQFDHPRDQIRQAVAKIVLKFTEDHLQAIAFPLVYMENLKKETPSPHFTQFLNEIRNKNPQFRAEVHNISEGLIKLSTTDLEIISSMIQKATIKFSKDNNICHFKRELTKAVKIFNTRKSDEEEETKKKFIWNFRIIEQELNNPDSLIFKFADQNEEENDHENDNQNQNENQSQDENQNENENENENEIENNQNEDNYNDNYVENEI